MGEPPRPRVDDILVETEAISATLADIVGRMPASVPTENEVWTLYARSERIVAKLKYRLRAERPGVFSELPRSKRPGEFLSEALVHLREADTKIQNGQLEEGLESLRGARTSLRAYLADQVRVRSREKRKAALSRRASSPSS